MIVCVHVGGVLLCVTSYLQYVMWFNVYIGHKWNLLKKTLGKNIYCKGSPKINQASAMCCAWTGGWTGGEFHYYQGDKTHCFLQLMCFFTSNTYLLACRHNSNMHMCCIHPRLWGIGVREACVLCLHPHSDLSNKHTLLPPPPTFSRQLCVTLTGHCFLCITCPFLRISHKQRWGEALLE